MTRRVPMVRGGAAVAHWAHNPEAAGSNPAPATLSRAARIVGASVVLFAFALAACLPAGCRAIARAPDGCPWPVPCSPIPSMEAV